jgi:hypothetical protein
VVKAGGSPTVAQLAERVRSVYGESFATRLWEYTKACGYGGNEELEPEVRRSVLRAIGCAPEDLGDDPLH